MFYLNIDETKAVPVLRYEVRGYRVHERKEGNREVLHVNLFVYPQDEE